MSGHSKWSQIKRQKGSNDQKRGAIFSKLAKAITLAARGGADPATNFLLRIAVDKARSSNMPKDNIDRAIARSGGGSGQTALEEIIFEAYGPGGTAYLITTATENRNRTVSDIRAVLNKFGAQLAGAGSVGYQFERLGQLIVPAGEDPDSTELAAIDAGAERIERLETELVIFCQPSELEITRERLEEANIEVSEIGLVNEPTTAVEVTDQLLADKLLNLVFALEELDDVVKVEDNFRMADDLLPNAEQVG